MADLDMHVVITRDELGLDDLEINDYVRYYITPEFLGTTVAWSATRAVSEWLDGGVTVSRHREIVQERVGVEVLGEDGEEALGNAIELQTALQQANFELQVLLGATVVLSYQCESADSQFVLSGPRLISGQIQVLFNIPRQPVPLVGAI